MTTTPTDPIDFSNIDERWNYVLAKLPAIGKDSVNEQQGFKFRSIDTVLDYLNPILAEAGVHIIPTCQFVERDRYTTKSGTVMNTCTVTSSWAIRDVHGEVIEAQTVGEGSDAGDKATSKAQTMALKYLLWPSLAVNSNEDPDATTVEPRSNPVVTQGEPILYDPQQAQQIRVITPQPQNGPKLASQKQLGRLYYACNQDNDARDSLIRRKYGKSEKELTSKEASELIDGLGSGKIALKGEPTIGIEQVSEAFGGAVVQNASDVIGPDGAYQGEPF